MRLGKNHGQIKLRNRQQQIEYQASKPVANPVLNRLKIWLQNQQQIQF